MPGKSALWFGYHPSDRVLNKRPDIPFPTNTLKFGDFGISGALDEAGSVIEAPTDLPRQLWEHIKGDWEFQFNVASGAYTQPSQELYEFGGAEQADVPGAYVGINFAKLVKEPTKTIGKFWKDSVKVIDPITGGIGNEFWADASTAAEVGLWRALLQDTPVSDMGPGFKYVKNIFASPTGPLTMKGSGVYESATSYVSAGAIAPGVVSTPVEAFKDVYEDAGVGVVAFVSGKKSAFRRTGAYTDMQSAVIHAAAVELSQKESQIVSALASTPGMAANAGSVASTQISALVTEDELLGRFKKLADDKGTKDGIANIDELISKAGFTQTISLGNVQSKLTDLDTKVTDLHTHITSFRATLTGADLERFNFSIKEMEGVLASTHDICARYSVGSVSRLEMEQLSSKLTVLSSKMSNNRYTGGALDRYHQSISRRYLEGSQSVLRFDSLTDVGGNPVMSAPYRSLQTITSYHKRAYLQEDGRDLFKTLTSSKGDFSKAYIYFGQVRDRVRWFSPAYLAGRVMARTHGLGLVYKKSTTPLHPIFDKNPLIRTNKFTERFSVTLGGVATKVTGKFEGGTYLEGFYHAWQKLSDGTLVGIVDPASGAMGYLSNRTAHMTGFFNAINGASDKVDLLHPGGGARYDFTNSKDMENLVNNWNKFRGSLKDSGLPLNFDTNGNLIQDAHNIAVLEGFFKKIDIRKKNVAHLDPFADRTGLLQRYASRLSLLQQKIFGKANKFVNPIIHWQKASGKVVADLTRKVLTKVLNKLGVSAIIAATGGAAAVFSPVIEKALQVAEKIIQLVTAKLIDKGRELLMAAIKGDFSKALSGIMDDAAAATQKALVIGCFVPVFLVFASFFLISNILVSTPLVDRAKTTVSSLIEPLTPVPVVPLPTGSTTGGRFFKDGCNGPTICGSFNSGSGCHGTDGYWDAVSVSACAYSIPTPSIHSPFGLRGTREPGFYCSLGHYILTFPFRITESISGPEYGFAADYAPTTSCSVENTVYAPALTGVTGWEVIRSFNSGNGTGYGLLLRNIDGDLSYRLLILHLNRSSWANGQEFSVGSAIGTLFPGSGRWLPHVHIEMQRGGVIIEPETVF